MVPPVGIPVAASFVLPIVPRQSSECRACGGVFGQFAQLLLVVAAAAVFRRGGSGMCRLWRRLVFAGVLFACGRPRFLIAGARLCVCVA